MPASSHAPPLRALGALLLAAAFSLPAVSAHAAGRSAVFVGGGYVPPPVIPEPPTLDAPSPVQPAPPPMATYATPSVPAPPVLFVPRAVGHGR